MKPAVLLDQNDVHGNLVNSNLTFLLPSIPKAIVLWSRNGWDLDPSDYRRVTVGALTVTDVQASDSTVTAYNFAARDGQCQCQHNITL